MHANATDETAVSTEDRVYSLEPLQLVNIPERHPVAAFASKYLELAEGHFIPDERLLLKDELVIALSCWVQHAEPVELGGHVDFYILSRGEAFSSSVDREYVRGSWLSETIAEEFVAARYHEAVTASILRKPMYSRGAVPSKERSFIMQYRGVFPMFAENHARLRLAVVSAETFIELKD